VAFSTCLAIGKATTNAFRTGGSLPRWKSLNQPLVRKQVTVLLAIASAN